MSGLIDRNLRLFFANKSGIFFSLMGAMISFVLYLIFLRQMMTQNWQSINDSKNLLDLWLMGGTLAVTAVTTTGNSLGQMVKDRESNRLADLVLTDQSYTKIHLAYLISAWLIGFIMQIFMYLLMQGYFMFADGIKWDVTTMGPMLLVMIFSSLIWSAFNMLVFSLVTKVDTLGKINTIIGTASGFFAGVYMPIGDLPNFAKNMMKLTPAPYNAAIFRQVMMKNQLDESFKNVPASFVLKFKKDMGIIVERNFTYDLKILALALVILVILVIILYRYNKQVVLNKI